VNKIENSIEPGYPG